jgi:hypothetical protein
MTPHSRTDAQRLATPILAGVLGVVVFAAAAIAGHVGLGVAVVVAFIWEVARGRSGEPYSWLGAIAGGSFILATAVLRRRS